MVGWMPPSRECRPLCQESWAPWQLSSTHKDRTTEMSSAQEPMCGHQSATSRPLSPYFLLPICILPTLCLWYLAGTTSLYGVAVIFLPVYLFSSGFGSNDSMWLTPPAEKIQITDLAFGWKCG